MYKILQQHISYLSPNEKYCVLTQQQIIWKNCTTVVPNFCAYNVDYLYDLYTRIIYVQALSVTYNCGYNLPIYQRIFSVLILLFGIKQKIYNTKRHQPATQSSVSEHQSISRIRLISLTELSTKNLNALNATVKRRRNNQVGKLLLQNENNLIFRCMFSACVPLYIICPYAGFLGWNRTFL